MKIGCNITPKIPTRQQKVIIFDSPDGTGKTNIGRGLAQTLKIPYFRMGSQHDNWRKGRFKDALEFDQTYLVELLRQTKYDMVIDRAYPAEWVYSQVYGRETNMEVLKQVDLEFARMGAYIIVPLRHDYSQSRQDEVVTNEMLKPLHDMYLNFVEWTKCSTITIYVDAFQNDLDKQLPLIQGELTWGDPLNFRTSVTLDRPFEKKDNKDIFDLAPLAGRTVGFKR